MSKNREDYPTAVILPTAGSRFAIREKDWRRLRGMVERIRGKSSVFDNGTWACIGLAAAFGLTAISLPFSATELSSWVIPTCWVSSGACSVLAFFLFKMGRLQDRQMETSRDSCLDFMEHVQDDFHDESRDQVSGAPPTASILSYGSVKGQSLASRIIDEQEECRESSIEETAAEERAADDDATELRSSPLKSLDTNIRRSILGRRRIKEE